MIYIDPVTLKLNHLEVVCYFIKSLLKQQKRWEISWL